MSTPKHTLTVLALFIALTISNSAGALEYTSFVYNIENLIFFSYDANTTLEIYESDGSSVIDFWGEPVLINNGNALAKGQHFELTSPYYLQDDRVYQVTGSKKFAVLTGDATTWGVSGYYAMDANGLGVSTEFYTYAPDCNKNEGENKFIIFGYHDDTEVTVQQQEPNGTYVNIVEPFDLNDGEHWVFTELDEKYIHVMADKPVSALTCYDQGYFVPSSDGGKNS